MPYILIIIIVGLGGATSTARFEDKRACEQAKSTIESIFDGIKPYCFPIASENKMGPRP